ncbi:MAG: AI-2E family transporter [Rhodobacteraceae bacterium]|nr:AI-2E family transporter [Paracoccaceae bacterium]
MALPVQLQLRYWGIAAVVLFLLLWVLGDVILPFVLGGAFAYMLDPIADRLERLGLGRIAATIVITFFAALVVLVLALLVIPTLIQQIGALINGAPGSIARLQAFLTERYPELLDTESTLRQSLQSITETLRARGGQVLEGLLSSAGSLFNVAVLMILVPVVTFYLLMDWDRMVARVDSLLPRDHAPVIRKLAREIDDTLAAFIRGQGTVCLVLGTYYAMALMLVGLEFGLAVGFLSGLVSFIPYVGAVVGGALAFGLAIFQFWGEWHWIGVVVIIFFSGQMLEGNILTPNLVGGSIGLHPVWLIFALAAFGTLFGFVGMLVAVPVAAALGVLTRFGIAQYQESPLYRGQAGRDEGPQD